MTESFDPTNGRLVLNSLQKRMDASLKQATDGQSGCIRAIPRVDGTLYFELSSPHGPKRLDWIGMKGEENDWMLALTPPDDDDQIVEVASRLLAEILDDDAYRLVFFYNRDLSVLRFDDGVVDVLLAGRFFPGGTSWFGYVFQDVFQEEGNRFRLSFLGPGGPVSFEVQPAVPPFDEDKLIVRNHLFKLYLVEDSRIEDLRGQVVHQVERFVGFLLSRAVHPGMRPVLASGEHSSSGQEPVSTTRWGNPHQWYQFFSDFEIGRSNICSFQFMDPISWVTHGEIECRFVEPDLRTQMVTYTNLPWEQERPVGLPGNMSVYTNLNEQDAVLGGMTKLDDALGKACANPLASFVCINNTCLPKIIGDDVTSAMSRFSKKCSVPILSLNTDLDSPDSVFSDLIRQVRKNVAQSDVEERAGLNLIGFPPNRGRREILEALGDMSIQVNACVLPDVGIRLFEQYLKGKIGIVYPYGTWVAIVEKVLSDLEVEWKVLPAPYGVQRTLEWFQAVGASVGATEAYESWKQARAGLLDEWHSLTREASSHSLAFVVDETTQKRLVEPTELYGFEILPLLEEMGFGLHVLVRTQGEVDKEPVLSVMKHPERVTFSPFTNSRELGQLLKNGPFEAVYSEVFFDTRIIEAGKAQFNLSMIEMGLRGAARSLKRLCTVCRWPFYSRYQAYMSGIEDEVNR